MYSNKNKNQPVCNTSPCWNLCGFVYCWLCVKQPHRFISVLFFFPFNAFYWTSSASFHFIEVHRVCVCKTAGIMLNKREDKWGKLFRYREENHKLLWNAMSAHTRPPLKQLRPALWNPAPLIVQLLVLRPSQSSLQLSGDNAFTFNLHAIVTSMWWHKISIGLSEAFEAMTSF